MNCQYLMGFETKHQSKNDPCYVRGAARFYELTSVPYNCRQCVVDRRIMPIECIDCIKVKNSSYTRPSYF